MKNKLTIEQELEIIEKRKNNIPFKIIMTEYGIRTNKTIYDIIERNGRDKIIANKKYSVDENYFSEIDTQDKAYWLGFLYADGYVRIKNNKSGELKIKLCVKDKAHIELFKKCINSTHKIIDGKSYVVVNGRKYESEYSTFSVYNTKLVNDLIRHGCLNNKTFKIRLPDIPEYFISHFIRGYFDGDGCISIDKNNSISCSIISNKLFIKDIFDIIGYGSIRKNINVYNLYLYRYSYIEKFYNLLYNDSIIYLERKRETFERVVNISSKKIKNRRK